MVTQWDLSLCTIHQRWWLFVSKSSVQTALWACCECSPVLTSFRIPSSSVLFLILLNNSGEFCVFILQSDLSLPALVQQWSMILLRMVADMLDDVWVREPSVMKCRCDVSCIRKLAVRMIYQLWCELCSVSCLPWGTGVNAAVFCNVTKRLLIAHS